MKKQLVKMTCFGTYRVILDTEAKYNPYRVTLSDYMGTRTLRKYGDFASCLEYLRGVAIDNSERMERHLDEYRKKMAMIENI